jgi:MFS family permease
VNNLNDGVIWGLLPVFLVTSAQSLPADAVGLVAGLYPLTWGVLQIVTGPASDRVGRKPLLVAGMWIQAAAFPVFVFGDTLAEWILASLLLGAGTAMVYPTFLSAVSDWAPPEARGAYVGVYRFWRDLGFAVGALLLGVAADVFGLDAAFLLTGAVTFASGAVIGVSLRDRRRPKGLRGAWDMPAR